MKFKDKKISKCSLKKMDIYNFRSLILGRITYHGIDIAFLFHISSMKLQCYQLKKTEFTNSILIFSGSTRIGLKILTTFNSLL